MNVLPRMPRIAYCSPVNPVASGISDYSEELLPFLGQYADVTLLIERGIVATNSALRQHLDVRTLDELPALHRAQPFDAIVYHMGNSPAHGTIYELAQQIPGVVVLHEWVLHHLKLWYAAERRRNVSAYVDEMRRRYGVDGERVARRMSRGQLQDAAFRFPLVEDVIERARGIIGHSRFVVDQARALRFGLPAAVVPMGVPLPPLLDRSQARLALRLPPAAPIWASFGHINPYKRLESALRAFAQFRVERPDARYLLVGSVSPSYDLLALIGRLGLNEAVTITGYVPRDAFDRYVAAADLCLNLRYPTAGETSASLLRLLGAARPTLVSAVGAFAELPADVCAPVDVDGSEAALILAYARMFEQQPAVAAQLGRNARSFVARAHTLDGAAQGYLRFLSDLYNWPMPSRVRDPLWSVDHPPATIPDHASTSAVATIPDPPTIQRAPSAISVGAELAELGVTAEDERPLRDVATTIADLLDES
jgi:glycosyltransferase involved in cell wall biosynthesis